jgi:molybdenum cofactor cytidylyltransferase
VNNPVVLILASGRGERFTASGGTTHKLDALLPSFGDGPKKTVLQSTIDAVIASGVDYHVERCKNPPTTLGMGKTIARAVENTKHAGGWIILPGDLPLIDPKVIAAVALALVEAKGAAIVMPSVVSGSPVHPIGFPKSCFDELVSLEGDRGASQLLKHWPVLKIDIREAFLEGCWLDVDTSKDLDFISKCMTRG